VLLAQIALRKDYLSRMNESSNPLNIGDYIERLRLRLGRAEAVERPPTGTELKAAAVLVPLLLSRTIKDVRPINI
jgi:hypothetical protein